MEKVEYDMLNDVYHKRLAQISLTHKRYLYNQINWNVQLIGIKGARGTGKTTLILQHILETFQNVDDALYVSLDHIWFNNHSLYELAEYADAHGITHLFIDEISKNKNWAQEIKTICDTFSSLNIVYTGSSILEIDNSKVDLSRRQTVYHLTGLSFREFLLFEGYDVPCLTLKKLLENHVKIALNITKQLKILPLFEKYILSGYYPFYKVTGEDYHIRLQEVINTVIDVDVPCVSDVTYATLHKVKTLLMVLAENVPTTPVLSKLWQQIETTNDMGLKMLNLLDRADILNLYSTKAKNYKQLIRPEKVFLNNTNLMYALTGRVNKGSQRETFFLNQLMKDHKVTIPKVGDFAVDGLYLFEVGGKGKTFEQIADIENSFLAVDDTEVGSGSRIPLWMFGLLY